MGLSGVSIPGFSQWRAAELNPPHLKAFNPWEAYLKSVVGSGHKVRPGDIVPCEIPILPTSTLFRKNKSLKLDISGIYRGKEKLDLPFGYTDMVNKGKHTIYTGGKFDSYLHIPVAPRC